MDFIQTEVQLAAWEGTRRVLGSQLHALRQGQQERLRQLGKERQLRLELRRSASLLQEIRGQPEPLRRQKQLSILASIYITHRK